ncbi:hypothetical protein [Nostoc sphaeroides]|uniref:Uncharacterized protein n=1 Tax=Nostoc sphaeroides CCNUC1 TaxID=2653204 RepID=A0A5P8VU54_9NOSO|nr:hypothetical protein [Nostoc sphaeroides]QFS43439.1 hypothetical protein GXM_00912 [Nostoc sphaeroides CCNUC1]
MGKFILDFCGGFSFNRTVLTYRVRTGGAIGGGYSLQKVRSRYASFSFWP